jgi:acyl-[acyl carrier protein]--UDP-N-acetylglucosamine O-acyltransferase
VFRSKLTLENAIERVEAELPALPEVAHLVAFLRTSERGLTR